MKARARMLWTLPAGLAAVPAFHVAHATQYMSVDEALKYIVSMGVVAPPTLEKKTAALP